MTSETTHRPVSSLEAAFRGLSQLPVVFWMCVGEGDRQRDRLRQRDVGRLIAETENDKVRACKFRVNMYCGFKYPERKHFGGRKFLEGFQKSFIYP